MDRLATVVEEIFVDVELLEEVEEEVVEEVEDLVLVE